jgi:hypothetical protein
MLLLLDFDLFCSSYTLGNWSVFIARVGLPDLLLMISCNVSCWDHPSGSSREQFGP